MSLVEISEEDVEVVDEEDMLKDGEGLLSIVYKNNFDEFINNLQMVGPEIDLSLVTKSGASLAHLAAANNNLNILQELVSRGIDIHQIDYNCQTILHAAVKEADRDTLRFLVKHKIEINFQNKQGDTALHLAVAYDNLLAIEVLVNDSSCKINIRNKSGETPLCMAVIKGKVDIVHCLISYHADMNAEDKDGHTPLHHAIGRHQTTIALMLINAGAHVNQPDRDRNTPLHLATIQGLLPIVQALCAFGCKVDCYNNEGLTALQVGARLGVIDVVRCLLLAGASPFIPSKDNVYPDIMAYARGHKRTGSLLHTMSPEKRAICIEQLIPSNKPICKIKLKIFGSSISGKTTLINSLQSGYLRGMLNTKLRSFELFNTQESNNIGMKEKSNGIHEIKYELDHEEYTRGIEVKSINMSNCGEFSVWEFSGYEPYYSMYDHFIGDTSCIHLITLSMLDSTEILRHRLRFWLEFVASRISPAREMLDHCGSSSLLGKVVVVVTHCNTGAGAERNEAGLIDNPQLTAIFDQIIVDFQFNLEIHPQLLFVDSTDQVSNEFRHLRTVLTQYRAAVVDQLPYSNQLVETTAAKIHTLIHKQEFPSLSWQQFVERLRDKINPLCNEDHLKDLIQQLQYMGEVIYLDTESEPDIIVLSPNWLCNDVIGYLLSFENISGSRVTGSFTKYEVQMMLGVTNTDEFLRILSSLDLCVEVGEDNEDDNEDVTNGISDDSEIQYEFPTLNFVEPPPTQQWRDKGQCLGLQVHARMKQLVHLITRIQIQLRRSIVDSSHVEINGENIPIDLDQWYHGSMISCNNGGQIVLITLENNNQVIEIKARSTLVGGSEEPTAMLFGLFQDAFNIVLQTINEVCGSLEYEIFCLGNLNDETWHNRRFTLYSQGEIMRNMLDCVITESNDNSVNHYAFKLSVEIRQLLFLNHESVIKQVKLGPELHVSSLRLITVRKLCQLLDPPDNIGRDWCLLAVRLGLQEKEIAKLDSATSKTGAILTAWGTRCGNNSSNASIKKLIDVCIGMDRMDAAYLLTTSTPLYQFIPFIHSFNDDEKKSSVNEFQFL